MYLAKVTKKWVNRMPEFPREPIIAVSAIDSAVSFKFSFTAENSIIEEQTEAILSPVSPSATGNTLI
jgi:hypothetical protein